MNLQHDHLRPICEKTSTSESISYSSPTEVQGDDPFWDIFGGELKAMFLHVRQHISKMSFNITSFGDSDAADVGSFDHGSQFAPLLNLAGVEPEVCEVVYWTQLERAAADAQYAAIHFGAQVTFQSPLQLLVQQSVPLTALERLYSGNKHAIHCSPTRVVIAGIVSQYTISLC
jgi:hypothetical protein